MALIHTEFFSNTLEMCVSCDVILPQAKDANVRPRFKTLWLLHGMSDDETIWQRRTGIERYAVPKGLAVVMPAAHLSSYANMAHGGRYFDYISEELPQIMRGFFPLSEKREDNYICGLSMGGAGAMKIGLAKPEAYAAIGCLSAGCINRNPAKEGTPQQAARAEMLFGSRDLKGTEEDVFGCALRNIREGRPLPRIYHTCGDRDFILGSALQTKAFFESEEGAAYEYVYEQDPGAHEWAYWDSHIVRFLAFLNLKDQQLYYK